MRAVVNTEVLDLIYEQIQTLRQGDLNDKNRDWLVSVYNATKEDAAIRDDTGLENMSDTQLMDMLYANTQTGGEGDVETGVSGIPDEAQATGTARNH